MPSSPRCTDVPGLTPLHPCDDAPCPEPPSARPAVQPYAMQQLPEDVQNKLLSMMEQPDIAHLATSCRQFHSLAAPLLHRMFRCVSCQAALFRPRELELGDRATGVEGPARGRKATFGPSSKLPRRSFFQLRDRAPGDRIEDLGLVLDARVGAANFHVLRHLAQTVYRNVRFPLPQELKAVRALRCAACGVFVGFRHAEAPEKGVHDFVHHDFVELVDSSERVVTLAGEVLPEPEGTVRCARNGCRQVLFERDDVLPWAHVLASSRLTDLDAYLEWDHSWAGAATAAQPAFFVKRLRGAAGVVRNVRAERLRQGDMEVGDVHCASCDAHIGWKFVAELPGGGEVLHNYDQVGRFGIIRNAVAPAEPRYPM